MSKQRLDMLLAQRGLAESREQAQRVILAGKVFVGGERATKAGHRYDEEVELSVTSPPPFVSRGGEKLEGAFRAFDLDVTGQICLDVGASTGGFTDCLLQHGAAKVIAIDVGKGQLHWRLRQDPRVIVLEGVNARHLTAAEVPDTPSFATADVSFISLTKVLPAVIQVLSPGATLVTLIKPQFEAGREQVEKGGVVRNADVRREVVERIRQFGVEALGLEWCGSCESPLRGPAGNVEFLAHWRKGGG